LWPTYWALWIASDGLPSPQLLLIFTLGVFLMRSAGCIINDFADRHVDGQVARTKQRPLVSGQLTEQEALFLFVIFIAASLGLVINLHWYTIKLSLVALAVASIYPFTKRFTHMPQVILGIAFSWGMIMAFAEVEGRIPLVAWLLFSANVVWTIAYDTMYAMVDREDDLRIGVKSTAILFGRHDKRIVGLLQLCCLGLLFTVGEIAAFGWPFHLALLIVAGLFSYQQLLINERKPELCFKAFLNNHYVGLVIFLGIAIELL